MTKLVEDVFKRFIVLLKSMENWAEREKSLNFKDISSIKSILLSLKVVYRNEFWRQIWSQKRYRSATQFLASNLAIYSIAHARTTFFLSFHIDISTKNSHTHFFQASKRTFRFLSSRIQSYHWNKQILL